MHIHNKSPSAWLDVIPYTNFAIKSKSGQNTSYSLFSILYGQKVPLTFNQALENPSDNILQPATTILLRNTIRDSAARAYRINSAVVTKTIQN